MTNSSNSHEPSAEFRAQLKREIARAVRSDQLFGAPPAPARTRRIATAFGIAAGVMLTLLTGMVLGASASYAAAAEPDAPRPTFAMRPITNALTAIGCGVTKTEPHAPKTVRVTPPVQQQPVVAVPSDTAPAPAARRGPDRAKIVALATQYQPFVVRGDTAASYMVMVFDAADKYLWSTYGSGGLSVEIGGDTRTAAERVAYMNDHRAQYQGEAKDSTDIRMFTFDNYANAYAKLKPDSLHPIAYAKLKPDSLRLREIGALKQRRLGDSLDYRYFDSLHVQMARGYIAGVGGARGGDGSARGGGARGGGGRGGIPDSIRNRIIEDPRMFGFRGDSFALGYRLARTGGGRGEYAFMPTGVSPVNAPDGSYKIGWGGTRRNASSNDAAGLTVSGNGQSGIEGIPSAWLSMGESYTFAGGDLAPQALTIVVVHLTGGTIWKGR